MAFETTFCDSGAVKAKAGNNVNDDITSGLYVQWINQAESDFNDRARVDFTASFSGLSAAKQKLLEDYASSHSAVKAINWDSGNYTTNQATNALNLNWTIVQDIRKMLDNNNTVTFIEKT